MNRSGHPGRGAFALVLALLLAGPGCSGLLESDEPPASHWWLDPATPDEDAMGALAASGTRALVIDVGVVPGLDTDRILNLDRRARLNHYAGAHWPDHLPEVLTSVLVRSFEGGGHLHVRSGERADEPACLLRLETRAFYGRVNAGVTDRVEVAFSGTLECPDRGTTLSTEISQPVEENRLSAIVAAFQAALDRAVDELAAQLPGA